MSIHSLDKECDIFMRKPVAITLILTIFISMFAISSCSNEKKMKESQVVDSDSTWYSTERIDVYKDIYSDGRDYRTINSSFLGMVGDEYCCSLIGDLYVPDAYANDAQNIKESSISEIILFNSEGSISKRLNLYDYIETDTEDYQEVVIQITLNEDSLRLFIASQNQTTYENEYYIRDVNLSTGEASEKVLDEASSFTNLGYLYKKSAVCNRLITFYQVGVLGTDSSSFNLIVEDSNNNLTTINMSDYFPNEDIWRIDNILEYGEDKALIIVQCQGYRKCIELDFSTMSMKDFCPDGTEWMGRIEAIDIIGKDGKFYAIDKGCVLEYDFENQEVREIFNFDTCNINKYDIDNCELVDISEDSLVFICNNNDWRSSFSNVQNEFYLYKLTKCDTNPNAGKTILDVGCITGISRAVAEAICNFNDSNTNYFIQFDSSYIVSDLIEVNINDENYSDEYSNLTYELSNQMVIDLMNGEGPDIIIDGFGFGQMNNSDCFIDLSGYVTRLDSKDYFTNVFDGARVNGALYQLPITFGIQGIITGESNVDSEKEGFTFEEYEEFVHEVCNGTDPIHLDQNSYLCKCISAMNDLFIDGKKLNYNNDAFKETSSYVKNNVFDTTDEFLIQNYMQAYYFEVNGMGLYLNCYDTWQYDHRIEDIRILGIPSVDGRGPALIVNSSVGISSHTSNPDACWEFIKCLLDDDVQTRLARGFEFPVNYSTYVSVSTEMITRYNYFLENGFNYTYRQPIGNTLDLSLIGDIENLIRDARVTIVDPTIDKIIYEEIQPYFKDQKTIDQVLKILQNRVKTVLNERM